MWEIVVGMRIWKLILNNRNGRCGIHGKGMLKYLEQCKVVDCGKTRTFS